MQIIERPHWRLQILEDSEHGSLSNLFLLPAFKNHIFEAAGEAVNAKWRSILGPPETQMQRGHASWLPWSQRTKSLCSISDHWRHLLPFHWPLCFLQYCLALAEGTHWAGRWGCWIQVRQMIWAVQGPALKHQKSLCRMRRSSWLPFSSIPWVCWQDPGYELWQVE